MKFNGNRLARVTGRLLMANPMSATSAPTTYLQTRGIPKPAMGEKARYILERPEDLSRPFGTIVEIKEDKADIRLNRGN